MLSDPAELLEIEDGQTVELRVQRGEFDQLFIKPERNKNGEVVPALRLHVVPGSKQFDPQYWDITSKRLMAQLRPILSAPGVERKTIRVTAHGRKPDKHFTVEVR